MSKKATPSLLEPEATGGEINEKGLTYQEAVTLLQVPGWLSQDGFTSFVREAMGDIEVKFYGPGQGIRIQLLEAKDHVLAPAEFWAEIARFERLGVDQNTYQSFALVAPGVSPTLAPLANALSRLRGSLGFYAPDSLVASNSYQDFVQIVKDLDQEEARAAFIFERVELLIGSANTADFVTALFQQALLKNLPEFPELRPSELREVFRNIQALVKERPNEPIHRRELETALDEMVPSQYQVTHRPVRLNTVHLDVAPTGGTAALQLPWGAFWGGDGRDYPPPDKWNSELVTQLTETRDWINNNWASRHVRLFGNRRLSASLAIGSVFSAVAGYVVEMQSREGSWWATNAHPSDQTPEFAVDQQFTIGDGKELVVSIGILRLVEQEVQDSLPQLGIGKASTLNFFSSQPILSPEHANLATRVFKTRITDALRQSQATRIHLFYTGPAHLALFMGHRLNATAPIQCYEWVSTGTFVPTCLLFAG